MTLEFDVNVSDKIGQLWNGELMSDADRNDLRSHEQALLDAMISDRDRLRRWIIAGVLSDFEGGKFSADMERELNVPTEDESVLFKEAIKTLPLEHRGFWEELEASGFAGENNGDVSFALDVKLASARLEEPRPALVA